MAEKGSKTANDYKCHQCKTVKATELYELQCKHRFCCGCFIEIRSKVLKCVCGEQSIDTRVVFRELEDPVLININKAKSLANKYEEILVKRQNQCEKELDKLNKAIRKMRKDEKAQKKQIESRFQTQLKKLQAHYDGMQAKLEKAR